MNTKTNSYEIGAGDFDHARGKHYIIFRSVYLDVLVREYLVHASVLLFNTLFAFNLVFHVYSDFLGDDICSIFKVFRRTFCVWRLISQIRVFVYQVWFCCMPSILSLECFSALEGAMRKILNTCFSSRKTALCAFLVKMKPSHRALLQSFVATRQPPNYNVPIEV